MILDVPFKIKNDNHDASYTPFNGIPGKLSRTVSRQDEVDGSPSAPFWKNRTRPLAISFVCINRMKYLMNRVGFAALFDNFDNLQTMLPVTGQLYI